VKDLKDKMESLEEQLNTVVSLTKVLGDKINKDPSINSLTWAKSPPKTFVNKKTELNLQGSLEIESSMLPLKSSEQLVNKSKEEEDSVMRQLKKQPKRIFQFQKTSEEEIAEKDSEIE